MNPDDDVKKIKGIGEKTAALFEKLNIRTVSDLLCHYPREYDEYKLPVYIEELKDGDIATVEVRITKSATMKTVRSLKIISTVAADSTGQLQLTWFNQPYLIKTLRPGYHLLLRGKVSRKGNHIVMEQPKIFSCEEYRKLLSSLQPRYPLTEGLTNNAVSKAMGSALSESVIVPDYLTPNDLKELGMMRYRDALMSVHFPSDREVMLEARKRLVFDEFLFFMIHLNDLSDTEKRTENKHKIIKTDAFDKLVSMLPYDLTGAQKRVLDDIFRDFAGEYSCNRLVEGDVGSGKTIVAILSMLESAMNGYQSCLMAPTDVLARQHFEEVSRLLIPFGIKTVLLTGGLGVKAKREAYQMISSGEALVVVGTHALIQESVVYHDLGLVITDEQHRFGVKQREALREKSEGAHTIVMSATPIPRSLAIILYGELDISRLDELPAKRLPIKSCVVDETYRDTADRFITSQVESGHQIYCICPMIEENENVEAENVIFYAEKLQSRLNSKFNISYLHGKMKANEKNEIMNSFASGNIDILVSTTVIEVGINVPNATVMLIENAERFGLATLHQLRGRVGRGEAQSYCIFFNSSTSNESKERLNVLVNNRDGFKIAEEDLRLRGPGDLFGIRQSGDLGFRLADIYNDAELLKKAAAFAGKLSENETLRLRECPQFRSLQLSTSVIL